MNRPPPLTKKQPRKPTHKKTLSNWRCVQCATDTTPVRRGGPKGPATLCNACGLRESKKNRALNSAAARARARHVESKEQFEARKQREAEEERLAEEMRRKSEARERENARRRHETMRKRREERAREQQQLQHKQNLSPSSALPIHQPIHPTNPSPPQFASTFLSQLEQSKPSQQNHSNPTTPMEDIQSDWLNDIFGASDATPITADEFAAEARAAAERSVEGVGDSCLPEVLEAAKGINLFSTRNTITPYHSPTDVNLSSGMQRPTPMVPIPNHNMPTMSDHVQPSNDALHQLKIQQDCEDANVHILPNANVDAVQHRSPQCFSVPRQQTRTPDVPVLSQESMQYTSSAPLDANRLPPSGRNIDALESLQRSQAVGTRWQAEMRSVVYGQSNNAMRRAQTGTARSAPAQPSANQAMSEGKTERAGGCSLFRSGGRLSMTVDELMRADADTWAEFAPQVVDEIEERLMAQQEAMEQLGDISVMLEERSNMVADEMLRSKEAIAMLHLDAARIKTILRGPM